ncbi:peptidoglycan-binding domain-containing protein [Bacillus sp. MB2021]|uniref:peptidoglycan-binding domain-containing protein n=1 Tax=Bacillus sp. MB2021 TaxID=1408303 RepID=UPI0004E10321|nr:peptidoglycan-binding protein [Bacillus sp. MB2021]
MELRNFDQVDIKEVNGEYTLILRMKEDEQSSYDTEFGSEFFYATKKNGKTLITATEQFIKKEFPKIKKATIILAVGTVILASFLFQKAEAHEVTFNMSYLYFGNTKSYISQIDKTQGNLSLVSPSYFDINADGSLKITTQYDSTFAKEMHSRGMKVVPPAKTTTTTSVTAAKSTATAKAVTSAKQTKYPTLKSGSKGAAVTDMQNKLKKTKLYTGKVNGVYDTATKKAVIAFQKKYKLKADGIAGTATLSKLDSVIAATKTTTAAVKKYPTLKQGSQGKAVKDMQNKLIKTKIYKGKALGKYDTATKKAVIAFQKKYKLTADGIAGPVTLAKLDSVTKSK